jgi:hypothetical protein
MDRIIEQMRNLPWSSQQRLAREGEQGERVALERLYGKAVWEPLIMNPRITVGEVARISTKGPLPKPLIETIVSNPSWLSNGQVRRGLLTNPRLGQEQVVKVLRAMPKHELKLAPKQSIYGPAVREAARRLVRETVK